MNRFKILYSYSYIYIYILSIERDRYIITMVFHHLNRFTFIFEFHMGKLNYHFCVSISSFVKLVVVKIKYDNICEVLRIVPATE